jgi:predicted RNA binding protein YcfA (HicA-like mRNA interferase family)
MKRNQLIKHLKKHGAYLLRESRRHSIFQKAHHKTQVPGHNEIVDKLERKIIFEPEAIMTTINVPDPEWIV